MTTGGARVGAEMSGEHGIMRPNPALLHDLEERREKKSKPVIAHQVC